MLVEKQTYFENHQNQNIFIKKITQIKRLQFFYFLYIFETTLTSLYLFVNSLVLISYIEVSNIEVSNLLNSGVLMYSA